MREIEFRAWLKKEKKMVKVKAIDFIEEEIRAGGNWYSFEDIELMQYTSITDMNLKKIFEGYIVKFEDMIYKIVYDSDECHFKLVDKSGVSRFLGSWRSHNMEVIGNIYENKELLENV